MKIIFTIFKIQIKLFYYHVAVNYVKFNSKSISYFNNLSLLHEKRINQLHS